MEVPPISYTRSGDVAIAYQVLGDGPVDLVFVPEFSNLIWYWQHPLPAGFFRELASFFLGVLCAERERVEGPQQVELSLPSMTAQNTSNLRIGAIRKPKGATQLEVAT